MGNPAGWDGASRRHVLQLFLVDVCMDSRPEHSFINSASHASNPLVCSVDTGKHSVSQGSLVLITENTINYMETVSELMERSQVFF